jgi:acylphosphatase
MNIQHVNITITGEVQGVGFRFSARNAARTYNVKGFVKNNYDGTVFIEAEADQTMLDKFIAWCYEGPSHARVKDVAISGSKVKNYSTFDIRF